VLKIKSEDDPIEKTSKKIKEAKTFTEVCGDQRSNTSFTSIIRHSQQSNTFKGYPLWPEKLSKPK
jgi:hypothetical protein